MKLAFHCSREASSLPQLRGALMTVPRRRPPRRRQPLMRFERGRVCSWRKALAWLGLGTPQSEETEVAEDHVSCGLWDPWARASSAAALSSRAGWPAAPSVAALSLFLVLRKVRTPPGPPKHLPLTDSPCPWPNPVCLERPSLRSLPGTCMLYSVPLELVISISACCGTQTSA